MCITNFVESTWKVTKFNTETVENGSSITRRWFNVFGKMVQKHEVFQSSSVRYLRVYIEVLSIVHISQKIQFAKYRAIKKLDWPDSKSNKWRHCSPSVPLYRITIAKFSFSLTSASAIHIFRLTDDWENCQARRHTHKQLTKVFLWMRCLYLGNTSIGIYYSK